MSQARIVPLEPPYSAPVRAAFDAIMPPGVPPLALFRAVAVNERVFLRMMAGGLLDRGSITMRERELVIDRVTWLCGAEYEYGVHVAFFGPRVKLDDAQLLALCSDPPAASTFTASEGLLLGACDELHRTSTLSAETWAAMASVWSAEQLVELVALVGYYHAISFLVNALAVPHEPFAARFSAPSPGRTAPRQPTSQALPADPKSP